MVRQEVDWLFTYEVDYVQAGLVCETESYFFGIFVITSEVK